MFTLPIIALSSALAMAPAPLQPQDDTNPAAPGFDAEHSDAQAIAVADQLMQAMGGRTNWDAARFLTWTWFDTRSHWWDRQTGDIRIEGREAGKPFVVLMNVKTKVGRVFHGGEELTDPETLKMWLEAGIGMWENDRTWLVLPFMLKDDGVTLKYLGANTMDDGRESIAVQVTFREAAAPKPAEGDSAVPPPPTPRPKYIIHVGTMTGLVEQWDYFPTADATVRSFSTPWLFYARYNGIMLASDRGDGRLIKDIDVLKELPRAVFTDAEPLLRPPPPPPPKKAPPRTRQPAPPPPEEPQE